MEGLINSSFNADFFQFIWGKKVTETLNVFRNGLDPEVEWIGFLLISVVLCLSMLLIPLCIDWHFCTILVQICLACNLDETY